MQYKTLLSSTPGLKAILSKLDNLEMINRLLAKHLDATLLNNCRVANLRNGILILSTTSPAWNHKLRFCALDLLSKLRQEPSCAGLKAIEVKVSLPHYSPSAVSASQATHCISADNAKFIQEIASQINSEKLANSLNKLAKHSSQSKAADKQ